MASCVADSLATIEERSWSLMRSSWLSLRTWESWEVTVSSWEVMATMPERWRRGWRGWSLLRQ